MQPSETTSSVLEQEWARSLRSGPPNWKRGSARNDIDVLTIPEPPSGQEVTSTSASASASASGDASLSTEEIAAAMARIKDDRVPTTPEEREKDFVSQIEKGEQLCTRGPEFAVEAALAFFRALRVYPSPVELIKIFQNTVPKPVLKMVSEMMRLNISDPPPSTSADEAPPSTLSKDDGSASKRGPPSGTSSQDWEVEEKKVEKKDVRQTAAKVGRRLSSRVGELFKTKRTDITTQAKVDEQPPKIEEHTPVAPLENPATTAASEAAPAPAEEPKAVKRM
ncbi:hypothetical protein BC826DRAFT_210458 [Russula brevipes]|nr:hypothetical protein BC826DRAFT_210458 [Russula brevipes]